MKNLSAKINAFIAAHKRFPTVTDFRKADHRLWEELTPVETWELLQNACSEVIPDGQSYRIAFRYWLYWLQAVRFRVTNRVLAGLMITQEPFCLITTSALTISRLKTGRLAPSWIKLRALYKLYLLSADERRKLKQEILNSNGTTTK